MSIARVVTVAASLLMAFPLLAKDTFNIEILRQLDEPNCTAGYLRVDGNIIAYTLERPWLDNQQNISSIPKGTYHGFLRYDKNDHWRIQLDDVPGRPGIQIHVGNQPDQTKGCVLVGRDLVKDGNGNLCRLVDSKGAYADLKRAFYGTDTPNQTPDKVIVVSVP